MNQYCRAAFSVAFAALMGCESPPSRPLDGVAPEAISSIAIRGRNGEAGQLTDARDIQAFLDALKAAEPRKTAKVLPEFELLVQAREGSSVRLRMNRGIVGPDVSPTAVVWRWRFRDNTAYRLITTAVKKSAEAAQE